MASREHRRCLLISNSTVFGETYLDHCEAEMREFLAGSERLAFVPFAAHDRAGYGRRARERFREMGVQAEILTEDDKGRRFLAEVPAVFVGGGNTFRLLDVLQRSGLLELLARRALEDMIYMGASAGSNIAAPTIRTTNDMPIVEPPSFESLDLVGFQINPHYRDPKPGSRHMGETRQQRLEEFLEENAVAVVGLREGAWIRVEGARVGLGGANGAMIFRPGREPEERNAGDSLCDLETFSQ